MTVTLNDHHSVVATALAAIPSAMKATIMLAITELGARATKLPVPMIPIHIAVATNPNAELLCARYSRSHDRDRGVSPQPWIVPSPAPTPCPGFASAVGHGFMTRC